MLAIVAAKYTLVVPTLVLVTLRGNLLSLGHGSEVEVGRRAPYAGCQYPIPQPSVGWVTSLSFTLIVPVAYPTFVGLNTALMMHVPALAITRPFVQVVLLATPNVSVTPIARLPYAGVRSPCCL